MGDRKLRIARMRVVVLTFFLSWADSGKTINRLDNALSERAVWFERLPKIFNWYTTIIDKFTPPGKARKFSHRILDLQKKVYWEIRRCPDAGIDAQEQALAGLEQIEELGRSDFRPFRGEDFGFAFDELSKMMHDDQYLKKVSDDFEYEDNDDFQNVGLSMQFARGLARRKGKGAIGNRPGKKKPGKNTQWKVMTDNDNQELETVSRPPRVLLYKVNKSITRWFDLFLPKTCKKFTPIFKRLKGLKRRITNLMPKHEWIPDDEPSSGDFAHDENAQNSTSEAS